MNENLKNKSVDMLFEAILQLKSVDECYSFFEDLCTIHEILSLAQRLEVAELLQKGETYTSIGDKTGASTATISRINRCLNYGEGGYKTVLKRLKENNNAD
jgi:TrpR-related protein YerC/YecD